MLTLALKPLPGKLSASLKYLILMVLPVDTWVLGLVVQKLPISSAESVAPS